jgi:hypothetical protein
MTCKICSHKVDKIFIQNLLGKYSVNYFKCSNCYFLQTEDPYWLDEAYNSGAISALDTGIISRNIHLSQQTKQILLQNYVDFSNFKGLDYGGGEGITVRILRDMGFNFYRYDLYAENLYARFFDLKDLPVGTKFNVLTAFEVFEHLIDPMKEIEKMLEYSDVILFSTELQPSDSTSDLFKWWYIVPEGGQHISFYNYKTLQIIAEKFNLTFYTNNSNLHILSKKSNLKNPFIEPIKKKNVTKPLFKKILKKLNKKINWPPLRSKPKLPSLISQDFEMIKKKIILNNEN